MNPTIPSSRDKLLFTPGPLTTSLAVKKAMLHDAGSWHADFNGLVREIRQKLLRLAGLEAPEFECIPMQGSGTYGVESVIASVLPPQGKLLVLANGAYGERILQMAQHLRVAHRALRNPEDETPNLAELDAVLTQDREITHVAMVHCETTTGILNPLEPVAALVQKHGKIFILDAMSSFGAIPIDFARARIDYLISSANKCIEGVPGFSFVLARRAGLLQCEGYARSLSLDLIGQLRGFEKNGQFRYTPPTHSVLAFAQALLELEWEGGVAGRGARYRRNHETLLAGMRQLGFRSYLAPELQSYIITSFYYPPDPKFSFLEFYRRLSERGFIIYPGKLSQIDLFRIGSVGRIFEADMAALVLAIGAVLAEMEVKVIAP